MPGIQHEAYDVYTPAVSATTTLISGKPGVLGGIFCSSASAGRVTVYDGSAGVVATAAVMVSAFTPVAGTFHRLPGVFSNGLFVVVTGNASLTVFASVK